MSQTSGWKNIIRFRDSGGKIRYGEPSSDLKQAEIWDGGDLLDLSKTGRVADVVEFNELLAPYTPNTVLCVGLNYKEHAAEAKLAIPEFPIIFYKPRTAITGPYSKVILHPAAPGVDYENELCVIISETCKDVPEAEALKYVLGYTIGNDVSSRMWQLPARGGGQYSYAKSFDGFVPIGPRIVAASEIDNPQDLELVTKRNGKIVQNSNTSDMIFGVAELIHFASQGTTLEAGTLIMTGTPPGVAVFMSNPPDFLKEGEIVECEIEGLGALRNEFTASEV